MTALLEEPIVPAAEIADCPTLRVPKGKPRRIGLPQRALAGAATFCNAAFGPRTRDAFGILMYHRVTERINGIPRPTWNVPPERFEQQLAGLLKRGYRAWPLRRVLEHTKEGCSIPSRVFVVTFDDVYLNVFTRAYPILRKLETPATLFLATAYLDSQQPFPSDDWSAAGSTSAPPESWLPITTEACREMQASGLVELAAHTHTHADFRARPAELLDDLARNRAVLRERFGIDRPTFAFPYGNKNEGFAGPELSRIVRQAGFECALSTEAVLVRPGSDPFDWGRFAAEEHDTTGTLAAKLSGWHTTLRSLGRNILRRQYSEPASR